VRVGSASYRVDVYVVVRVTVTVGVEVLIGRLVGVITV
jgi:hypothetical protein